MRLKFDEERSEIAAKGRTVVLSPFEFDMLRRVSAAKRGISPERIFAAQYQLDPEGGPDWGKRVIHQRRWHLNRKLKQLGLVIMPHKRGVGCVYELKCLECTT
jgi:hypothetical protein